MSALRPEFTTYERTRRGNSPANDHDAASPDDFHPVPVAGLTFTVGAVNDPAEAAADQMAGRAMSSLRRDRLSAQYPARAHPAGDATAISRIRRMGHSSPVGPQGGQLTGHTATALERLRGRGRPLPPQIRAPMERAFQSDFSAVRLHEGAPAAALNRSMGALAFTVADDVFLGDGTAETVQTDVLAHELAHVAQESGGALQRLRRKVDGRAAVVRRLLGFEVELRVPTLSRGTPNNLGAVRDGPEPDPLISTFFAGGRENKAEMGVYRGITLESDHDSTMARLGKAYLKAIGRRDPDAVKDATYNKLSNLEYKTAALDELAPGSTAEFRRLAETIDGHAQQLFDNSPRTAMGNIPGAMQFQTGVPVAQLTTWLANSPHSQTRAVALKELQNHITWHMYVQATVGVLPSGLAKLFESQAERLPVSTKKGDREDVTQDAASAVVRLSKQFRMLPEFHSIGLPRTAEAALEGLFTLAASYAVGRAMAQTTAIAGSEKNAVSLFNKLSSNAAVSDAMPSTLKLLFNWDQYLPLLPELITAVTALIHDAPQTTVDHWISCGKKPRPDRTVIYGPGLAPAKATAGLISDWLTGSDTIPVFRTGEDGQLHQPDAAPKTVADRDVSFGQTGVPLEYRWIFEYPAKAGDLWPVFNKVLGEVRTANLTGLKLGPDERARILKDADA